MLALACITVGVPLGLGLPTNGTWTGTPVEASVDFSNDTLAGPPKVRYIVLTTNRDRASCVGANPETSRYFDATPGKCFTLEDGGSLQYIKFTISSNGINAVTYSQAGCHSQKWASGVVPFGGCVDVGIKFSLDVVSFLPAPNPGQVLIKQYIGSTTCSNDPVYMLITTSCWTLGGTNDIEVFCGEGVYDAYNQMRWTIYGSKNSKCTGPSVKAPKVGNSQCAKIDASPGFPAYGAKTAWCGSPCRAWKTMRSKYPKCDAPTAHTRYAVNLEKEFGPRCGNSSVGAGQCCYVPLGYAGGHPLGTDCSQACLEHVRLGAKEEWCADSSGR